VVFVAEGGVVSERHARVRCEVLLIVEGRHCPMHLTGNDVTDVFPLEMTSYGRSK
jgi:hypothetical protein